ncbi:MAG: trypsin-like peptidase domain-containing protein [Chloroflexi bacterium]|nr:MAG: trypsin-like peptidase domain-containing protein [Chloroflexota bacterium]
MVEELEVKQFTRLFWLVLVLALCAPALAQEDDTPPGDQAPLQEEESPAPTNTPAVVLVAPTPTATPAAVTPADLGARAAQSVVAVETEAGQGSGVALTGGILTAAHVVLDATSIQIMTADHRQGTARVSRMDAGADLALLQTDLDIPTLDMEDLGAQHEGDPVLVLGYVTRDADNSVSATLSQGEISGIGHGHNNRALLQTNAKVLPGNSGGAVVNLRGRLIGIPTFVVTFASIPTGFAVGSDTVYAFLALPAEKVVPPTPTPAYRADPRGAVLPSAFLGGGWTLDSEDKSQLSQGAYSILWHTDAPDGSGRIVVRSGAWVLLSAPSAAAIWEQLGPPDPNMVQFRISQIGDAVAGWAKPNGTEVFLLGRARNVILTIDEQRTSGLSVDQVYSPGGVASMLTYIVDRINSQAH